MANGQLFGVTGSRRLKRDQTAELRARLGLLPSILQAEQSAEQQKQEEEFRERQFKEEKRQSRETLQFERQKARQAFGLELGKTGINLATSGIGGTTIGQLGTQARGLLSRVTGRTAPTQIADVKGPISQRTTGTVTPAQVTPGGFFSNLNLGSVLGGGLAGFGAGAAFGGESRPKKLLFGAGAGALTGLLSGGLSGALGGGASGLFAGAFS